MPLPDEVRLLHMLDACRKVVQFSHGKTREALDSDEMLQLALVRLVEIIGEAATHVSASFKDAHPEVPWRRIAGARNHLIHGYFDVDHDILWQIITVSVPELIGLVEPIVPKSLPWDTDVPRVE